MCQFETDRILLRKLRITDLYSIYRNIRDKEVGKWTGPPPAGPLNNPVGNVIRRCAGHFTKGLKMVAGVLIRSRKKKCLRLGIIHKETGKAIGIVSFAKNDYEDDYADLGFWIGRKYWGIGLMSEILPTAFEFGFKQWGLERIDAWTFEDNVGSKKVMEKCGMTLESIIQDAYIKYGKPCNRINFSIHREQFFQG